MRTSSELSHWVNGFNWTTSVLTLWWSSEGGVQLKIQLVKEASGCVWKQRNRDR